MNKYYFCAKTKLNDFWYFSKEYDHDPTLKDIQELKKKYQIEWCLEVGEEAYKNGINRYKQN